MTRIFIIITLVLAYLTSNAKIDSLNTIKTETVIFLDKIRNREVPVEIYYSTDNKVLNNNLVIISACYECSNTAYSFIANNLVGLGYVVVSIQHELVTDEPLAREGNIFELLMPVWKRSVKNILSVIQEMKAKFPLLDSEKLILLGHSNGGDISILFAKDYKQKVFAVITLDNRRMPLPISKTPKILSFRADEFIADKGVIPTSEEQKNFNIKIFSFKNTKHADLSDDGNNQTKETINKEILKLIEK